jgi:hypothetical protein
VSEKPTTEKSDEFQVSKSLTRLLVAVPKSEIPRTKGDAASSGIGSLKVANDLPQGLLRICAENAA